MKDLCKKSFKNCPLFDRKVIFIKSILMTSAGVYKYTELACDSETKCNTFFISP